MNYRTHILTSVTGAIALSHAVEMPIGLAFTGGLVFGSLLPDIDIPGSLMGKMTSIKVGKDKDGKDRRIGLSSLVNGLFGHRGFTHSIAATALLSLLLLIWNHPLVEGLVLGYALHILGDMFSKTGVPLFHPLTKKRIKLPLYTTNKWSEHVVFCLTLLALVWMTDKTILDWLVWQGENR